MTNKILFFALVLSLPTVAVAQDKADEKKKALPKVQISEKLAIRDGKTLKFHRVASIHNEFESTQDGKTTKLKSSILMDMKYSVTFKKKDADWRCSFSFTAAHFKYSGRGNEEWKSPKDMKPIIIEMVCDARGLIALPKDKRRLGLRSAFKAAGCTPKLAKIPQLYFFSIDDKGLSGSFNHPYIVPSKAASTWTVKVPVIYGLVDGLLDDFSLVDETWTWTVGEKKGDLINVSAKLSAKMNPLSSKHRGTHITETSKTEGQAQIDPSTGILINAKFKTGFQFKWSKDGRAGKGTLTRSESLTRN